ncbi:hypothetical protein PACTADRAFT_48086 [Pachysolen tannophilus NRRL Y-2460]|uniref:Uncharacterized protein n=1 Tax=Pachysolen tannophilus NRRL Y-2460 TaxID=669874 RepID=A0A1E4U325_PACTA|nr:hypothetical protein PACTADRAFT_48086 [Pachysolen tannophilus NRRL Y-2460]
MGKLEMIIEGELSSRSTDKFHKNKTLGIDLAVLINKDLSSLNLILFIPSDVKLDFSHDFSLGNENNPDLMQVNSLD